MARIKVMIVDDHEVVRLGLRAVLEIEKDFEVSGEAPDAASALRAATVLRPDVVLMDVRMPGTDGIEACRQLRERLPDTRVLMLTSYGDEDAVMA
ncbi:MAG: response regulator transcription factor, partial [Chloroflexi bacterium]|nr:response regulator transcription factor [Chloroflexota bacterium]